MEINIQSVKFNISKELLDYTQKRLEKLDTFSKRIISIAVYLKLENTSDKENKIAEIKVHVPGDEFMVKKQEKRFEEAIDKSADALERMIKKWKQKNN